jgi:hypothetical protein
VRGLARERRRHVGIVDAGLRTQRRFGALFNVADAVCDYGGKAEVVPSGPGQSRANQGVECGHRQREHDRDD